MQPVFSNRRKSWCDVGSGDGQGTARDSGNLSRFGSTPTISTTASCRTTTTEDSSLNAATFSLNEGLGDFWGLTDTPEATLEEAITRPCSPERVFIGTPPGRNRTVPRSQDAGGGLSRSNTFSLGEAIGDLFGLGGFMEDPKQVQPAPAQEPAPATLLQPPTRQHRGPRIELEDVEVTDMPYAVYFKLRAVLPGNNYSPISVMKSYKDLKDLHRALQTITVSSGWLPDFPSPPPGKELNNSVFFMQIGDYLACIAGNKEAVHAHFVQDFFRATEEYRERHDAPWIELRPPSYLNQQDQNVDVASRVPGRSSLCSAPSSSNAQAQPLKEERPAPRDNQASAQAHTAPVLRSALASSSYSPVSAPPRPPASLPTQEPQPISLCSEGSDLNSTSVSTPSCMTRSSYASSGGSGRRTRRRRPWCVICLAKAQETAIDPCGHICMCQDCTAIVRECPVCRGPINKVLRVFVA